MKEIVKTIENGKKSKVQNRDQKIAEKGEKGERVYGKNKKLIKAEDSS